MTTQNHSGSPCSPAFGRRGLFVGSGHRSELVEDAPGSSTEGQVVERYLYDPYGRVTFLKPDWSLQEVTGHDDGTASAFGNEILFTGYRYNPETGMYQARNRQYHPTLSRFMQRDPLGYVDGGNLYAGYFVMWGGVDPMGLSWVWPWDSRASWKPRDTARVWGRAAKSAGTAVIDVPGHANWVLTGERDPTPEVLDAASRGWLERLGVNPFNTDQSLGQWLYTGQGQSTDEVLEAAVQAARPALGSAWDCWKCCMKDLHKRALAGGAGATGFLGRAGAALPFPKFIATKLFPGLPRGIGESPWTSAARLFSIAPRYGIPEVPAPRYAGGNWTAYARDLKHGPDGSGVKAGRKFQRQEIGRGLRVGVKAAIAAEAIVSTYCSIKCGVQ